MNKDQNNKLYVCLGNIGKEYELTRHNAGFLFGRSYIDYLTKFGLQLETKENKLYTLILIKEKQLSFLFPKTLMNLSGHALSEYFKFTNIEPKLIIVHDDLDLLLGTYKINETKGPKNHNGLLSIEKS